MNPDNSSPWQTLRFGVELKDPTNPETTSDPLDDGHPLGPLEDALFELGAVSVTLLDGADHPLHEPDPGAQPLWPSVVVEALFDNGAKLPSVVEALQAQGWLTADTPVTFEGLQDQEWTRAWMDRFVPMSFGDRLWVCPSHIDPHPNWPVVIRLDPGLAFGSGTHPTTALCLRWLDGWFQDIASRKAAVEVVDFGCGSGILGIAAALLGADRVWAVDHDPQALIATQENARANGLADQVVTLSPEAFFAKIPKLSATVVVANILAQPLIDLAPQLMGSVDTGGHLVLSGILKDQALGVQRAYQALDENPKLWIEEDWVCLAFAQTPSSHYN